MEPYEILATPLKVYLAPVGETFPDVDEDPAGNWDLLGTNGDENYAEDGVTVTHGQTIDTFTPLGLTVPLKAWRSAEELTIGFTLHDLSLAEYGKVLNNATVNQTAAGSGTPGYQDFSLYQGRDIAVFALLLRGLSPYGDNYNMQYEIYKAYQSENPAPVFRKNEPAGLAIQFSILYDQTNSGIGNIVAQDAAAL